MIIGSKGGSGSARTPVDTPESLRSKEFTRIIDVISEGEIEGLVDGLRSVYIEGTPLQNQDNTFNFKGVTLVENVGTPNQSYVPGFAFVENEISVVTDVLFATPIIRTISNSAVTNARVRISLNALGEVNTTTGDSTGSQFSLAIDVKSGSGAYVETILDTVQGKTSSKYTRQYAVPLDGVAPWSIRVRRTVADSGTPQIQNSFKFDSYTEVIDVKLARPNTAAIFFQADSSQFSAIPNRSYKCRGRIIRVPTNYNEDTRVYSGIWNGSFKLAYSNNPAWIFYDLVTHPRYGLAKFVTTVNIDKWRLYEIGVYCDGMVNDGNGNVEPRYTCNMYLQTQAQAYAVLNELASSFDAMPSYTGDSLNVIQDSPRDATYLYTRSNVIEGKFNYQGASQGAKHSVVNVTYNDPTNHYKKAIVSVVDDDVVRKIGYKPTDVVAVGCTSRGQATRKGRRVIYTEQVETEMVSFSVALDSLHIEPGEVFKIADPTKTSGSRCGGRLLNGTTTSVLVVDAWADPGAGATITVMMPDGTLEKRNITLVVGTSVTIDSPLSTLPVSGAVWLANGSIATERYWRALTIDERSGKDKITFDITALAYDPTKYAKIDDIGPLLIPTNTRLPTIAKTPENVSFTESVAIVNNQATNKVTVSWDPSDGAKTYLARYKIGDNNNWDQTQLAQASFDLNINTGSILYVAISAIGNLGIPSPAIEDSYTILGESGRPLTPANLALEASFDGRIARVKWDFAKRIKGYNGRIKVAGTVIKTMYLGNVNRFDYSGEQLAKDYGSLTRSFDIEIQAIGANDLTSTAWASLTVANSAPVTLTGISVQGVSNAFLIECNLPTDPDYEGIRVWMSTTSGFTPSDSNLVTEAKDIPLAVVTDGAGVALVTSTTYYFKLAAFDTFGRTSLNISSEYSGILDTASSTYLHIKYSNDGGTTFTASSGETPGAYLGLYTDSNPVDSTNIADYTFALIRGTDGTNGTNGSPGTPGSNGQSTYLHIKYSNDGGSTFTSSAGETVGAYIGTYTDFTLADSTNIGDYTFALIKGNDGTNGTNGTPGTPGSNGQSTYLHIKYSNDGGSTFTSSGGETPGAYIGTFTDFTLADSTNIGDYSFALIKGADGTNGTPATPGSNGQSTYLHIKYSDDGGSTFTSSGGETPGRYIGTYTDFTLADSSSVGSYVWALIKGADGSSGPPGPSGPSGPTGPVGSPPAPFGVSSISDISTAVSNGAHGYGTKTASPTGGTSPYTYAWVIEWQSKDNTNSGLLSIANPSTASVSVSSTGTDNIITGTIGCTVTDAVGATGYVNFSVYITHGTPL